MQGSLQRVRKLMTGEKPDHIPLFDLISNDAVLKYFNHGQAVEAGDARSGAQALAEAVDATRYSYFAPNEELTKRLPDGREQRVERWTIWTADRPFASSEEYAEVKRKELAGWEQRLAAGTTHQETMAWYQQHLELRKWFGEDFYFLFYGSSPALMATYTEVGLEQFAFFLVDCDEVIIEQLERNTATACHWIDQVLPGDDPFDMVFIGEDIAFKNGPMVSPAWLRKHYFPRLKRVVEAFHRRGKRVMFHSDGNLNSILDELVESGIDTLNPIEVAAGMDLKVLHERYPGLVFAGAIDVSVLLPFGTPQQVKDAVVKAIEDTEGRILIGSSTEVMDTVPLENFLAMREAAMSYRL